MSSSKPKFHNSTSLDGVVERVLKLHVFIYCVPFSVWIIRIGLVDALRSNLGNYFPDGF